MAVSYGVGCRHGLDPVLLWLWHKLAAVALIWPLAWEPPYAAGVALEKTKKKKKKDIILGSRNKKFQFFYYRLCISLRIVGFCLFVCFYFFGCTHSIYKLPGQWLNLSCSYDLQHSCSNARSFIHCTTAGTPVSFFFFIGNCFMIL